MPLQTASWQMHDSSGDLENRHRNTNNRQPFPLHMEQEGTQWKDHNEEMVHSRRAICMFSFNLFLPLHTRRCLASKAYSERSKYLRSISGPTPCRESHYFHKQKKLSRHNEERSRHLRRSRAHLARNHSHHLWHYLPDKLQWSNKKVYPYFLWKYTCHYHHCNLVLIAECWFPKEPSWEPWTTTSVAKLDELEKTWARWGTRISNIRIVQRGGSDAIRSWERICECRNSSWHVYELYSISSFRIGHCPIPNHDDPFSRIRFRISVFAWEQEVSLFQPVLSSFWMDPVVWRSFVRIPQPDF